MIISEGLAIDCDRALRTTRGGDNRLGLEIARMAYRQARREAEPAGLLLALNTLAICQSTNGSYIEAVATAIDAFHLAKRLDDPLGIAHALTTLAGAAHNILDSNEIALNMLEHSLALAVRLKDISLEVRVRNARGVQLGQLKRFDEAEAEYRRALALTGESDGTTPSCLIIGNIANLAVKHVVATPAEAEGRAALIATAQQRVTDAMECALLEKASSAEVRAHFNLGVLCVQRGEYEEALRSLRKTIEVAERFHLVSRIVDAHIEMGAAYMALGRADDAVESYEIAYREAGALRPTPQLAVACERITSVYADAGRTGEANRSREVAERERAEYERERAQERRELARFWQEVEQQGGGLA